MNCRRAMLILAGLWLGAATPSASAGPAAAVRLTAQPRVADGSLDAEAFGLLPDTGKDCSAAFAELLSVARDVPGTRVVLRKGVYDVWAETGITRQDYQSNTDVISSRQNILVFENHDGTVFDGGGATIRLHGEATFAAIVASRKVTISNLILDMDRMAITQAKVVEQDSESQTIEIDQKRFPTELRNGNLVFDLEGNLARCSSTMKIDSATGRNMGDGGAVKSAVEVGPGRFKIAGGCRVQAVGDYLVLRHHRRSHAGIFILHSDRVTLADVTMHANCGLGVLVQLSKDFTARRTHICAPPGLYVGPHDDAFHVTGCRGLTLIEQCYVSYTPDDPVNVHGNILPVTCQDSPDTLTVRFGHGQSIGQDGWGVPGDTVSIVDTDTLLPAGSATLKYYELIDPDTARLTFDRPVTVTNVGKMALENLTATCDLVVRDCVWEHNRARGVLCTTLGKILIERNTFRVQGAAILISGDANGWFESGAVQDVMIRDNLFDNCLIAPTQFSDGVIAVWPVIKRDVAGKFFHRNVRVTGNTFKTFGGPIVFAKNIDGLTVRDNKLVRTEAFRPWTRNKSQFVLSHTQNVDIRNNSWTGMPTGPER